MARQMGQHTISLRGPWTLLIGTDSQACRQRLNIRRPEDWSSWRDGRSLQGAVILQRRFNWTFPHPTPERVHLRVVGPVRPLATLNDQKLDGVYSQAEFIAEIANLLLTSNLLDLRFESQAIQAAPPPIASVELEIYGS
jgi:hypothetical protein